jgi:NAD(P)-dependent dehydrogenase (short-subunit alcohol dehydrogenase family)
MAIALANKGIDVLLSYHSREAEAQAVVDEIKALGQQAAHLQLDVSNPASFDGFMDRVGASLKENFNADKLDFIINNAGIGIHAGYSDTTEEQFDSLMNIHLKAPFFLTQKALPLMNDGGGIVNVSSGLARFSLPGYDAYAMMKGGIETLTKYQAKTLGQRGIRANVIAPGAIETDFGGGAVRDNQEINGFIASQTVLGRAGVPDDIGGVVAFLCSDDARWVNGQRLEASGGMFL